MRLNHIGGATMLRFHLTAAIKSVPASSTTDSARSDLVRSIACNEPMQLTQEEQERGGYATLTNPMRVDIAVPGTAINQHDRFVLAGTDYQIRGIAPIPAHDPQYYELLIEKEA